MIVGAAGFVGVAALAGTPPNDTATIATPHSAFQLPDRDRARNFAIIIIPRRVTQLDSLTDARAAPAHDAAEPHSNLNFYEREQQPPKPVKMNNGRVVCVRD